MIPDDQSVVVARMERLPFLCEEFYHLARLCEINKELLSLHWINGVLDGQIEHFRELNERCGDDNYLGTFESLTMSDDGRSGRSQICCIYWAHFAFSQIIMASLAVCQQEHPGDCPDAAVKEILSKLAVWDFEYTQRVKDRLGQAGLFLRAMLLATMKESLLSMAR